MAKLSHRYMTTGKTIAVTIRIFVDKVMPLLLNMLPRFVIDFLPMMQVSFNFMTSVTVSSDFGAQRINSATIYYFPIYVS